MKILIVGQLPKEIGGNYTTGAANVVFELSKQRTHNVLCYTFGTNITDVSAKKASSYSNQYIGYKFNTFRILLHILCHPIRSVKNTLHYRMVDHQNVFRYLFYEDNIRSAINLISPDIIHVNSIENVSPVRFALDGKRIPVLLTCHGIFYRGEQNDIINRDRYLGNIKLADYYSGLTQESLLEYETILGISRENVSVIPNGVDCKIFYFSPEYRKRIRDKHDVDEDTVIFITVASVQKRKGQLDFIKVLKNMNFKYQYWIIGKGTDEDAINEYIRAHNLSDKVKLLGYRTADQLYKYYSAADVYVHSSWKEGQALSELEANATGLRTIVNKTIKGTIASDISSEDYYILDFDNIDFDSLEKWTHKKIDNRTSRNTFDWSIIADKYSRLYKQILSHK